MTRPKTPYEAASYDLNKFRERRMADRRFIPRDSLDRRAPPTGNDVLQEADGQADDSEPKAD